MSAKAKRVEGIFKIVKNLREIIAVSIFNCLAGQSSITMFISSTIISNELKRKFLF